MCIKANPTCIIFLLPFYRFQWSFYCFLGFEGRSRKYSLNHIWLRYKVVRILKPFCNTQLPLLVIVLVFCMSRVLWIFRILSSKLVPSLTSDLYGRVPRRCPRTLIFYNIGNFLVNFWEDISLQNTFFLEYCRLINYFIDRPQI